WCPENATELLAALDHLRHVMTLRDQGDLTTDVVAVAALRAGRLHTEAIAKGHWPIVAIGRTRRRQQREYSALGAVARRRPDTDAHSHAVAEYRTRKPDATDAEIARTLHATFGEGRKVDSLRRRIAELNPKNK